MVIEAVSTNRINTYNSIQNSGRILAALRPDYTFLLHRYEREIPKQEAINDEHQMLKVLQLEEKQKV
ncbi:MAG: hypothetical protein MUD14_10490, partial [Hydrococcus sp. Prado102]|nr:hypothetical protein [Hydrococcus sp. Prado102]